jgi:hypothetical protein
MHNDQSQLDLARMCMVQGRERGRSRIRSLQDTIRPSRASDSRPGEMAQLRILRQQVRIRTMIRVRLLLFNLLTEP